MPTRLDHRLAELHAEHAAGHKMLAELDAKRQEVRDTMLRISGAIQILEELAQAGEPATKDVADNGAVARA